MENHILIYGCICSIIGVITTHVYNYVSNKRKERKNQEVKNSNTESLYNITKIDIIHNSTTKEIIFTSNDDEVKKISNISNLNIKFNNDGSMNFSFKTNDL